MRARCPVCCAPLELPLIWRGRTFAMEAAPEGGVQRHYCPMPDLPVPNERWFRENADTVDRLEQPPKRKAQATKKSQYKADEV